MGASHATKMAITRSCVANDSTLTSSRPSAHSQLAVAPSPLRPDLRKTVSKNCTR